MSETGARAGRTADEGDGAGAGDDGLDDDGLGDELGDGGRDSDLDPELLDDQRDRKELRSRYYGLLQELRVVLPGVQVLLAFLFAVPFAEGFRDLDSFGRATFAVSLLAALLAVICLMAPTAMHRFGDRTARRARLMWSIRLTMVGLAFLALALIAALWTVARFVYDAGTALVVVVPVAIAVPVVWWLVPRSIGPPEVPRGDTDG